MSKTVSLDEIPYSPDGCELFERIRDLPGAAFLDSSHPHASSGRYDILTAAPLANGMPQLPAGADQHATLSYFDDLGRFHRDCFGDMQPVSQDLPFCGGLLGYIGYECGNALNKVASPWDDRRAPIQMQAYRWTVIQDHLLHRSVLAAQPGLPARDRQDLLDRLRRPANREEKPFSLRAPFTSNFSAEQYRDAFARIQAYIQAGDCYQVNLAQRFSAPCEGDPWHAYRQLRAVAAAPFAAYLATGPDSGIISLSPERFLSLHGQHVETSPIKGTRPRYRDTAADQLAAEELRSSEKDRAENLMIVDLLRNDLGRSCIPGSIHVDRLFEVQSFATVHHLVSTISGELLRERRAGDLLRDSFPGGSITGAPKRRAMEIIAELEPDPREAYCGTVLYISADGRMDSNIAIRTLGCRDGEILCWGGGGIVADSQWQQEYQETYDKVGKFLGVLEGMEPPRG